ncbi:MAG: leucine-rich repeat domain-containing protein, partial [Ureaplasma sp.]|nr:leucine-rich repeat domain-containing protein [Ureaplasma sp.]
NALATLNNDVLSIPLNIASNFYTEIPVSNLNNLQLTIENYISNSTNMFTAAEFNNQINSDAFKKLIADAISTQAASIGNVSYSGTTLTIAPNLLTNSKVKFSSTQSSSILVNGSLQLSVPTSNFYTEIPVSNLNNLQYIITNYILNLNNTRPINNFLNSPEFSTQLNSDEFKKMIADAINTTRDSIGTISYIDSTLSIAPNSSTNLKVKFTSNIQSDVLVNGSLQLKKFLESSENWFIWKGTEITGLSSLGLKQERIVLPSKTTSITNNVFENNKTIFSVDMSLTNIEILTSANNVFNGGVFRGCSNLVSIFLPQSLKIIGISAFYGCSSLTSITLPDSINIIASCAFLGCSSLTSIIIPDSVTGIRNIAFKDCTSLTSITIPKGVTEIDYDTFSGCTSLTSITIPKGVTKIRNNAFLGCTSLTSITIPDSVTLIGTDAFMNVPSTCIMNVSSKWNRTLATNAGYKGTFVIDDSL